MKTVTYIPKACVELEGVAPEFSGSIELRVPNYTERNMLKRLLMKAFIKDGELNIDAGKTDVMALMERTAELVEESKKFYISVDIKHVSGSEFKSFEDLGYEPKCESILQECAQELANGISLGKN